MMTARFFPLYLCVAGEDEKAQSTMNLVVRILSLRLVLLTKSKKKKKN